MYHLSSCSLMKYHSVITFIFSSIVSFGTYMCSLPAFPTHIASHPITAQITARGSQQLKRLGDGVKRTKPKIFKVEPLKPRRSENRIGNYRLPLPGYCPNYKKQEENVTFRQEIPRASHTWQRLQVKVCMTIV